MYVSSASQPLVIRSYGDRNVIPVVFTIKDIAVSPHQDLW